MTNLCWAVSLAAVLLAHCERADGAGGEADLNDASARAHPVRVNKCCENDEIMLDGSTCRNATSRNVSVFEPIFRSEDDKIVAVSYFTFVNGMPDCQSTPKWPVSNLTDSEDRLVLLPDGRLRHYINHEHKEDSIVIPINIGPHTIEPINIPKDKNIQFYDYYPGKYCIEKNLFSERNVTHAFAFVCIPEVKTDWANTDFLMKKILNPIFHAVAIVLYLLVAIIYFVLPTLRDLAGNIITTISICHILSQAASLVGVFTEFSSHVSFMIADIVLYVFLLAAFFWLNSFGFYIWKTFKSRNVFLRVTDMRKYCYYSCVVWAVTGFITVLAIVAHFLLDFDKPEERMKKIFSSSNITNGEQETIGRLGIAIFFTPVAFSIIINVFYYATTLQVIKRINTYGRIHYKLKRSFDLFVQLFLIMTAAWLFLLMSLLNMDGLIYAHIFVNLVQAVLVMYVCVVRQSHITFMLHKCCCYNEPVPTGEWGDEMTHMNGGNY